MALSLRLKENFRRIGLLIIFFIFAKITHKVFVGFAQEIFSAILLLIIFSGVLIFEYKSLFKKDLPRSEYFLNLFFIILFTVLMFATIYSEGAYTDNSHFLENGKISDLNYFDSVYFSFTTLTTVGYGDIVPVGIFRIFVMIEIFMGLIFIGTMAHIITKHLDK